MEQQSKELRGNGRIRLSRILGTLVFAFCLCLGTLANPRAFLLGYKAAIIAETTLPSVGQSPKIMKQEPLIHRWRHRIINSKGGFLFFKHIRKAGGTSLNRYLRKVLVYYNASITQERGKLHTIWANGNKISLVEQEFQAMDWHCPEVDSSRWKHTLSIIALRSPVERHLSEFFYSGLESMNKTERFRQLLDAKNYSLEFYSLLDSRIQQWIRIGMRSVRKDGHLGRHFSDEFQVRALTGETRKLPSRWSANLSCSNLGRPNACRKPKRGPCQYGGFPLGTKAWHKVTNVTLQRAKKVLKQFDVVLLTETMNKQAEFVADVFGIPPHIVSTAKTRGNVNRRHDTVILDGMKTMIPHTLKLLKKYSQYEMELYKYAVQINQELFKQWKEEKKQLQLVLSNRQSLEGKVGL